MLAATLAALVWATPASPRPDDGSTPRSGAFRPPATTSPADSFLVARPLGRRPLALRASPGGAVIARATQRTQFGSRLTLAVVRDRGAWLGVLATELPNGGIGWIPRSSVRLSRTNVSVVADLSRRTVALRVGDRIVRRTTVAVGAPSSPTPSGRYFVTDKIPGTRYGPSFGCCILVINGRQTRLPAGWLGGDRLAIHGTNAAWAIGLATSAGCLRVPEAALRRLMKDVPLGAPVFVHP